MLLATLVLFYVSYWLLSKMEVVKWNHFVKSKVQDALTSGSALALASAAFLAVYREGFETVLFYKALFLAPTARPARHRSWAACWLGGVMLVGVYVAIHRFGVRLPLKPFFGVTSAFLYYMAFVFAGGGSPSCRPASSFHHAGALGPAGPGARHLSRRSSRFCPGTAARAARRGAGLDLRDRAAPAPGLQRALAGAGAGPISATVAAAASVPMPGMPSGGGFDLIRSLERMDADLAELRAEVERMKRHVHELHHSRSV